MEVQTNVLARLQIPKASLSDVYNKAEDYGKKLYKYYTGEDASKNKYWKDRLREELRTNRRNGRYVPGKNLTNEAYDNLSSQQMLDKIADSILNYLSHNPGILQYTAFTSLEDAKMKIDSFGQVQGIEGIKRQIDNRSFDNGVQIDSAGVIGLQKELQKTFEKYLGLKPGEVMMNTDNYKDGSPIYDIRIQGTDGTEIVSEVKSSLGTFRILGINTPFKSAPEFLERVVKDCIIDVEAKKVILRKKSIEDASVYLLNDHFHTYQPFFESGYTVKLFTDFFLEKDNVSYLPVVAKDNENDNIDGSIEVLSLDNERGSDKIRAAQNYIKKKMTRYMLWYGK